MKLGGLGAEMFKACSPLQQRWLSAYCLSGDAQEASQVSGVQHLEAMVWIRDDGDFKEALDQARRVVGMMLEAEAVKKVRSEEGSDRLMIELLRAMMPEKYDPAMKGVQDDSDDYDGGYGNGIDVTIHEEEADAV